MQGRSRRLLSKYPSLKTKVPSKVKTPSRSPSPTPSESPSQSSKSTIVSPYHSVPQQPPMSQKQPSMSKEEENNAKDEKSIVKLMKSTLPKFSNEADWEMAIFELGLVLDRVWPHKDRMDHTTIADPSVEIWKQGQIV